MEIGLMKRKLFFFIEKLQITKNERIAVSLLMVSVVFSSSLYLIWPAKPHYSEAEYEKIEQIFEQKSRELNEERDLILARYEPMEIKQEVYTPNEETETALRDTIPPAKSDNDNVVTGNLININSATESELQKLPGIGPAYSKRIIEWRKQNGRFTSAEQLLEIKGIGEKRLANIKHLITL